MSSMLEKFSHDVAQSLNQGGVDREEAFDPAILIAIAEIIAELVALLQENCPQEPEDVPTLASNPSLIQRVVLRRKASNVLGRRFFRRRGVEICDGILEVGKNADVSDLKELFKEV